MKKRHIFGSYNIFGQNASHEKVGIVIKLINNIVQKTYVITYRKNFTKQLCDRGDKELKYIARELA